LKQFFKWLKAAFKLATYQKQKSCLFAIQITSNAILAPNKFPDFIQSASIFHQKIYRGNQIKSSFKQNSAALTINIREKRRQGN
jgi:hypothetical protein